MDYLCFTCIDVTEDVSIYNIKILQLFKTHIEQMNLTTGHAVALALEYMQLFSRFAFSHLQQNIPNS